MADTRRADPNGCLPTTAKATLKAANGDSVFLETMERACGLGTPHPTATGTYTVTGGTGRFEGATGNGSVKTAGTTNPDGSVSSTTSYAGTLIFER